MTKDFNSLKFFREYFNVPQKQQICWCLVRVTMNSDTSWRLGVWFEGTDKYIDVANARIMSIVNNRFAVSAIRRARRARKPDEFVYTTNWEGHAESYSLGYIRDVYVRRTYSPELMKAALL